MKYIYIIFAIFSFLGSKAQVSPTWSQTNLISFPKNAVGQPTGIGRVSHIAYHPTDSHTMFAVAASGGLWKTTNDGLSWTSMNTDSFPQQSMACILINYKNPNTMYIGSGDADYYGGGYAVYKTTDGGISWKLFSNGLGWRLVRRMVMSPTDTSLILAVTDNGIYKTLNGGANWIKKSNTDAFRDIAWKANKNSKTVYAVSRNAYYRSTNAGDTWTDLTASANVYPADAPNTVITAMCLSVTPADSQVVYILAVDNSATNRTFNGLFRSSDGGTTFTRKSEASNPPTAQYPNILGYDNTTGAQTGSQGGYNLTLIAHPNNANIIYTGSQNCWRSTDGGTTWKLRSCWGCGSKNGLHADHHQLMFNPFKANPWQLYMAHDGGVSRTYTDADSIWEACSDGIAATEYYKMGQSAKYKELAYGGTQDNGLQYYFDKENYTIQGGDVYDDFTFDAINPWVAYRNAQRSTYETNVNYNYNIYNKQKLPNNQATGKWVPHNSDSNVMFLFDNYNLFRTLNIRDTLTLINWSSIANGLNNPNSGVFVAGVQCLSNKNVMYMLRNDSTLIKVSNCLSNPSFTVYNLPFSTSNNVSIEMHPQKDSVVYVSSNDQVYRISTQVFNVVNITNNLPNQIIRRVIADRFATNELLYVVQVFSVSYKHATLQKWQDYSKGLPSICRITDGEIFNDGTNESILRVSMFGRGIWQTELYRPGGTKPIAKFDAYTVQQTIGGNSGVNNPCSYNYLLNDQSIGNPTKWKWVVTPSTGWKWQNGTTDTSRLPQIRFSNAGDYELKLVVSRGIYSDSTSKTITIGFLNISPSCTPTTTNNPAPYGMGISKFTFGDMTNQSSLSSGNSPNLQDFSCYKNVTLQGGLSHSFSVKTSGNYNEHVRIYIDYNNNGIFDTINERVYKSTTPGSSFSGNILLPAIPSVQDTFIRLRVMSDYYTINMQDPCANQQYGSVEDYALRIKRWPIPTCINNFKPNNQDTVSQSVIKNISWDSVAYAQKYYIYIDTTTNFTKKDSTTLLQYSLSNLQLGKTYYWKVVPYNFSGIASNCAIYSFVVKDTSIGGIVTADDSILCFGSSTILRLKNYKGNIQWQTISGLNWQNIQNATADTLVVNTMGSGSYRAIVNNGIWGQAISNNIHLHILNGPSGYWTGLVDSLWNNCKNWADGKVPNIKTDVVIDSNKNVYIDAPVGCRNIYMHRNANINHNGSNLTVYKDAEFYGKYTLGNIQLAGNGGLLYTMSPINNLSVNRKGITYIKNNTYITNNLYMISGLVQVKNDTLFITNTGSIIGGDSLSYIHTDSNGWLQLYTTNTNTFFPIGTAKYSPLWCSTTNQIDLNVTVFDDVLSKGNKGNSVADINYYINKSWHTSTNASNATGQIKVQWNYVNQNNLFNEKYCSMRWYDTLWNIGYPPQIAINNSIVQNNLSLNNILTVGSNSFKPFTQFDIFNVTHLIGNHAQLDWSTSHEFMLDKFIVYRGKDSSNLSAFDNIKVSSNFTNTISNYSLNDSFLSQYASPVIYYQVQALDTSGKMIPSSIKNVKLNTGIQEIADGVYIWPNPFTNQLEVTSFQKNVPQLFDLQGKLIMNASLKAANQYIFQTSHIAAGIYFLKLGEVTYKIVKVN